MNKRKAFLLIPFKPIERYARFRAGLQRLGYEPIDRIREAERPEAGDIVVTWNLGPKYEPVVRQAKHVGATLLVAENAYISPDGAGRHYHALSRDGHNGSGWWPLALGAPRWKRMQIRYADWKAGGDWIVVATQRGIGAVGMAMPRDWPAVADGLIRTASGLHVEIRHPPSRCYGQPPLSQSLQRVCCVVVWTSNVATHALLAGIPAVFEGPAHVCEGGAIRGPVGKDGWQNQATLRGDREAGFHRLAAAQWAYGEIESGEAFAQLIL